MPENQLEGVCWVASTGCRSGLVETWPEHLWIFKGRDALEGGFERRSVREGNEEEIMSWIHPNRGVPSPRAC